MTISLGGGHNVAKLAQALADRPELHLQCCTPSELTARTCTQLGLTSVWPQLPAHIDIAFDGCDSIDTNLTALKSNGGIHLDEKAYAENADQYVILAPAKRLTTTLSSTVPLTLEVLPIAAAGLERRLVQRGCQVSRRLGQSFAGYARTAAGNYLLDCRCEHWQAIHEFNAWVQSQNGVVATSLFENVVTMLLTFDVDGQVKEYRKEV